MISSNAVFASTPGCQVPPDRLLDKFANFTAELELHFAQFLEVHQISFGLEIQRQQFRGKIPLPNWSERNTRAWLGCIEVIMKANGRPQSKK
jgi:hypothetical protein